MDVFYSWCKHGRDGCLQGLELHFFGLLLEIACGCFLLLSRAGNINHDAI